MKVLLKLFFILNPLLECNPWTFCCIYSTFTKNTIITVVLILTKIVNLFRSEGCLCLPKEQYSGARFEHALKRLLEGKFR